MDDVPARMSSLTSMPPESSQGAVQLGVEENQTHSGFPINQMVCGEGIPERPLGVGSSFGVQLPGCHTTPGEGALSKGKADVMTLDVELGN